ncbi:MAG: hypothetical protein E7586_06485 [Ruminococcaceae bacterium]|nr:hypothetical protein [Oscillospiraceae bacterium]
MNAKKLIQRFIYSYLCGAGGASVILVLLSSKIEPEFLASSLKSTIVALIPIAATAVLMLRDGLDSFELWSRRIICALFNTCCIVFSYTYFGVFSERQEITEAFIYTLGAILLLSIPLYIIGDRRNKKKIKAINEKLKENKE